MVLLPAGLCAPFFARCRLCNCSHVADDITDDRPMGPKDENRAWRYFFHSNSVRTGRNRAAMLCAVLVRQRRPPDEPECISLLIQVHQSDGYPLYLAADQVPSFFLSPFEVGAWVAESRGSIVGHVALHWYRTDPTLLAVQRETGASGGDLVKVSRLFVAPSQRRSGTGRLLLRYAEQQARARDQRAVLDVGQTLHAAVALYESEGWSRIADLHLPLDEEWRHSADPHASFEEPPTIDLWVYASPG